MKSQSVFTKYSELNENGWVSESESPKKIDFAIPDLQPALGNWKVSTNARATEVTSRQSKIFSCVVDGEEKDCHATGGYYDVHYAPSEGMVIAVDSESPAYRAKLHKLPAIPKLSHWSDVVFLEMSNLWTANSKHVSNLRSVVRQQIENVSVDERMKAALKKVGIEDLPEYGEDEDPHVFSRDERRLALGPTQRTAWEQENQESHAILGLDGDWGNLRIEIEDFTPLAGRSVSSNVSLAERGPQEADG
ncbi:hypothetical protein NA57DRAFT_76610 [Rhizodiscina lignyota]|uniref:Uncharacterized protein n=1 Tax=Rhizodiscina lignyota TaxID=1504668 RepID=A0A9P4ID40_9PEZI|nr:hypothetical protein NA57DRAFT_76610 [Rhizodiscina lignyota]